MTSRRAFVIGNPIQHSLSPEIHNAAFQAAGLDVTYSRREVALADLDSMVSELREADVVGANVTVPYKEAVLGLVDCIDDTAAAIGAANTIRNQNGRLLASNTDAAGFERALTEAQLQSLCAATIVLGAGGSARAVCYALLRWLGTARLTIANRTVERAELLAADLRLRFPGATITVHALQALAPPDVDEAELVVNTTTVGMTAARAPLSSALLPRRGAVVDIIYRPAQTRLLELAERAGLRTLNGLPMLVHQAAAAWEIWTGRPAPVDIMRAAALRALEQAVRKS